MKKIITLSILFLLINKVGAQDSKDPQQFHSTVHTLWESLNTKDYELLSTVIDDDFTYQGYQGDMATMIMKQVVSGWEDGITEIHVDRFEYVDGNFKLDVSFDMSDGKKQSHELILSSDKKILKAEIAKIQLGGHGDGNQDSSSKENDKKDIKPEFVELSMVIKNRDMVVEATVNEKTGMLYFDTGAPSLILNTDAFEEGELDIKGPMHGVSGATGETSTVRLGVDSFRMKGIEVNDISAMGMDLSHLKEKGNLGLIGIDIMKGYLTVFDVKSQKIRMYELDENGNPKDKTFLDDFIAIDIEMYAHLPIIPVEINGRKLRLVLDSGGSDAQFNLEFKELLKGSYNFVKADTLRGSGKNHIPMDLYSFDEVSFANTVLKDVNVMFKGVPGLTSVADGLIGWDIFYGSVIAFDLDHGKLYVKR